jgi:hypothetical protein
VAYTWLSISSKTGRVLNEFPGLIVPSVKQQLMAYTSTTATLPLPTAPEGWQLATTAYAACLILLDGETPVWGGIVTKDTPDHTDVLPLALSTLEAYFDRRYVGDRTYSGVPQNLIVKDLVERYIAQGTNGGIPIRVEIVGGDGEPRDREYEDKDDKSVYSVLRELSGVVGGPEWTVMVEQLEPSGGVQRYGFVLMVGDRLGSPAPQDLAPAATFEMPGSITSFQAPRDYASGKGANDVMATSTAVADARPQSPHVVTLDPIRPTVEHRFSPSTSITNVDTLTQHAKAKSAAVSGGTRSLAMKARAEAYPRLGTDWVIGDDIGFVVGGRVPARPGLPEHESVPAFPGGIEGTARAVGWLLELGANPEVTPVLLGDDLEEG